jgi:hypothetical protein
MNRIHSLLLLLCISLQTSYIQPYQINMKQAVIVKRLKRAWQDNWVKAGTVTAACALIYALGVNLNIITPAVVCTATSICPVCQPTITDQKLFWKVLGFISGLATGYFGYAYFTAKNDDIIEDNNQAQDANTEVITFNDDFFDFPAEEEAITEALLVDEIQSLAQITEPDVVMATLETNSTVPSLHSSTEE